ncbi:MAG TPA: hypothetical protein V6D23_21515, partial [Candidatus Obscuribacterales bacterium]
EIVAEPAGLLAAAEGAEDGLAVEEGLPPAAPGPQALNKNKETQIVRKFFICLAPVEYLETQLKIRFRNRSERLSLTWLQEQGHASGHSIHATSARPRQTVRSLLIHAKIM